MKKEKIFNEKSIFTMTQRSKEVNDTAIVVQCFWIQIKFITEDSNAIRTIITTI